MPIRRFYRLYASEGLDTTFLSQSQRLVDLLKAANFQKIYLPCESINDRYLVQLNRRHVKLDHFVRAAQMCEKTGFEMRHMDVNAFVRNGFEDFVKDYTHPGADAGLEAQDGIPRTRRRCALGECAYSPAATTTTASAPGEDNTRGEVAGTLLAILYAGAYACAHPSREGHLGRQALRRATWLGSTR